MLSVDRPAGALVTGETGHIGIRVEREYVNGVLLGDVKLEKGGEIVKVVSNGS